jgi:hypothetical protein
LLSFDDKLARVTVGDGTPLSGIWSRATEGRSRAVRFRQGARFRSDRLCRSHRRPLSAQPEMARMPVARVEVQRPEGPESTLSGHNDPGLGRLDWAESTPTGVASGRTGVHGRAAIPLRSRNRLHRPYETFLCWPLLTVLHAQIVGSRHRHEVKKDKAESCLMLTHRLQLGS